MQKRIKKILLRRAFFISLFTVCFCRVSANAAEVKAYSFATVVKANSVISKQVESYNIEKKDNVGKVNFGTSFTFNSEPNTVLEFSIKTNLSDLSDNGDDDSLFVELKNSQQEVIKLKLKTGSNKIYFDQKGEGNLNIDPELTILTGGNALKGTYKATYDVIIFF
jgi:hypothetical protein